MGLDQHPRHLTFRRSLRTGYVGPMSNFTGTPRQLRELAGATRMRGREWGSLLIRVALPVAAVAVLLRLLP